MFKTKAKQTGPNQRIANINSSRKERRIKNGIGSKMEKKEKLLRESMKFRRKTKMGRKAEKRKIDNNNKYGSSRMVFSSYI